jgi:sugar phosphate isomerase/epimerase
MFCLKKFLFLCTLSLFSTVLYAQEYGLQLYSLRNQFKEDPSATMALVKSYGIKYVEMSGTFGLSFPEFISLIAKNELEVVSYAADFERLKNFPQSVADEARSYGAKYVVCTWIPHKTPFSIQHVEEAAEVFNAAGKILAQNGLLLCYHPHGYEFQPYESKTLFDKMIEVFDSRYVYFEMDVFWIKQAGQDPVALLKKYSNRWILIHLKDRKKGTPNSTNGHADVESNVTLGDGDVDIASVVSTAKKQGIKYFFIEDESSRSQEQISKSLNYLKSLSDF